MDTFRQELNRKIGVSSTSVAARASFRISSSDDDDSEDEENTNKPQLIYPIHHVTQGSNLQTRKAWKMSTVPEVGAEVEVRSLDFLFYFAIY